MIQTKTDKTVITITNEGMHIRFLCALKVKSKTSKNGLIKDKVYYVFESLYTNINRAQTLLIDGEDFPYNEFIVIGQ